MSANRQYEVERKYDVAPDGGEVPDLSGLPEVAEVAPAEELDQVATYFDTDGLSLLAARVTLRRRVGGVDDGWHLKLPAGEGRREEVHVPIADPDDADETVPAELLTRVRAIVRDRPMLVSAELRTHRVAHRLLDADGQVLAELCDDRVEARSARTGAGVERWREWELELVDGPPELLEDAEPLLLAAGAHPSASASKLGRVLAEALPPTPSWRSAGPVGADASTGEVLVGYLAEHLHRLHEEDRRLRTGDQEGVHQLRIAARRLRSALASYAPVLDRGEALALREELRWLGGVLSAARDAQVSRERLLGLVGEQADELVLGPVARRIDDELRAAFTAARAAAEEQLDGSRYFRLLDRLERFLDEPPTRPDARQPADRMLATLLRRDLRRVKRRHRAYLAADSPARREVALHDVRKAAKRLRYSAESAGPIVGGQAAQLSSRAKALQQLLGEHQDTVVARRVLRDLGVRAHLAGENGFTFGRLHALEEARAAELAGRYPGVYDDLPPTSGLRSWLSG
ncbi:CYTH and CHAD domain-containing protein [Nocardioides ferulae]|uniref:CYTH and CHAD domain-containing protein n=1 Tax=Nocardioides ferulae TaxID=2340821 RepID=UPI0013DDC381|nr:CYTH and CHAD domain-containing protein [Nocardioides ferulae]